MVTEVLLPPAGDNELAFIRSELIGIPKCTIKEMSDIPRWRGPDVQLKEIIERGVDKISQLIFNRITER